MKQNEANTIGARSRRFSKSVMTAASGLTLAIALAACSQATDPPGPGPSGSPPPPPPPPPAADTTPPVITFMASSTTLTRGSTIDLMASATDDVDGDIDATISCDGGSLTDGELTISVMSNTDLITCTAEATDAAGNTAQETLDIMVVDPPVTVSDFAGGSVSQPGGVVTVVLEGAVFTEDSFTGRIGDTDVMVARLEDDLIAFYVPIGLDAGPEQLEVEINGEMVIVPFTVEEPSFVIDDPEAVVTDFLNNTIDSVDQILAETPGAFTEEQRTAILSQRGDAEDLLGRLGEFTDDDLLLIATTIEATELDGLLDAAPGLIAGPVDGSVDECLNAAGRFTFRIAQAAVWSGVIALSLPLTAGSAVTGVGALVGGAVVLGATVKLIGVLIRDDGVFDNLNNVFRECINPVIGSISASLGFDPDSADIPGRNRFTAMNYTVATDSDGRVNFAEGVGRSFQIQATFEFFDEVAEDLFDEYEDIARLLRRLPGLPDSVTSRLVDAETERTEFLTFDEVVLTNISNPSITGEITGVDTDLSLEFVFDGESPEDSIDFSFEFRSNDGGDAVDLVQATLDLTPTVEDVSITVEQGLTTMSMVDVSAFDSARVSAQPDLGSVIFQSNGVFTYGPRDMNFGSDSFEVTGTLNGLDSEPGTVSVDIVRVFEGNWSLIVDTTQNDPSDICGGTGSFRTFETATVERLSQLDYRATYPQIGSTVISLDSIDDPDGLSFSGVVEEIDGTITNLNFTIPNSRQLSGSSTYRFEDEDSGLVCTGSTVFTGSK